MLRNLVSQLCVELDLPEVPLVENKMTLQIGSVDVTLGELKPGLYLRAIIAPCPKMKREELFLQLMKANYLGQGTGGSRIGLTPDERHLTLSLGLPYEVSYRTFRERFEDFINFTLFWKQEVEKFEHMERML